MGKYKKKCFKFKCERCGKDLERYLSHVNKYSRHFCSRTCKNMVRSVKFPVSDEQIKFVIDNYKNMFAKDIAKILNLPIDSIRRIIVKNNLQKTENFKSSWENRKSWNKEEENILIENYPNKSNEEIGKILNRSISSILSRAKKLKLNKSKEYIKSINAGEKCYFFGRKLTEEQKEIKRILNSRTFVEKFGEEKAKQVRDKLSKATKGKSWEQKYGKERADEMRINQSKRLKGKPHTLEHIRKCVLGHVGLVYSEERKKEQSKRMSLEGNPRWLGGKSFEPYPLSFNRKFKKLIRERDNFICLKCNIFNEDAKKLYKRYLVIHHINYDKMLTIPENCCALCSRCNAEANSNRTHWTKFFQGILAERYGYKYDENLNIILEVNNGRRN